MLKNSAVKIEMLFPGGKSKALILSFDDGRDADRRLVKLMNKYGLVGTFHLNSNKLGTKNYLTREEVRDLYRGHEVSVHSVNHPDLTKLSKNEIVYEVAEDRRELERLTGGLVRGLSYPFGNYNDTVVAVISGLGIEYARTVKDTYGFDIPDNFLEWHPTIHQFAQAFNKPGDTVNDNKELAGFYRLVDNFLKTDNLALLYVWGHSFENDSPGGRWAKMEKFFKMVANNPDVCYTTQIALVDYIHAFKNLKFTVSKSMATNLGSIDVCIKINSNFFLIPASKTVVL
jgi:peptidoglycan/xylan/chitin deacetylase (PgdA/CDA1 family)